MAYEDLTGDVVFNEISKSKLKELEEQNQLTPNEYWLTNEDELDNDSVIGLPLGTILPSAIVQEHPALHLLDGSILSQSGIYSNFATLLKQQVAEGKIVAYTNAQYDGELNTYGQCGHFVIDDTNNTFRLPTITKFIENLTDITSLGSAVNAGLPNITGTLGLLNHPETNTRYEGAFSQSGSASNTHTEMNSNSRTYTNAYFDASKSNAIYGNSTTVQPNSVKYPYYIVLANNLSIGSLTVDINNIINDVNAIQLLLNTKLTHYPFVTKYQTQYIDGSTLTRTLLLSDYIGSDYIEGAVYEVQFCCYGYNSSTMKGRCYSDLVNLDTTYFLQFSANSQYNGCLGTIYASRSITYERSVTTGNLSFKMLGYRRVY